MKHRALVGLVLSAFWASTAFPGEVITRTYSSSTTYSASGYASAVSSALGVLGGVLGAVGGSCGLGQQECGDGTCAPMGTTCCVGGTHCGGSQICIANNQCLDRSSARVCADLTYCQFGRVCTDGDSCVAPEQLAAQQQRLSSSPPPAPIQMTQPCSDITGLGGPPIQCPTNHPSSAGTRGARTGAAVSPSPPPPQNVEPGTKTAETIFGPLNAFADSLSKVAQIQGNPTRSDAAPASGPDPALVACQKEISKFERGKSTLANVKDRCAGVPSAGPWIAAHEPATAETKQAVSDQCLLLGRVSEFSGIINNCAPEHELVQKVSASRKPGCPKEVMFTYDDPNTGRPVPSASTPFPIDTCGKPASHIRAVDQ